MQNFPKLTCRIAASEVVIMRCQANDMFIKALEQEIQIDCVQQIFGPDA